MLLLTYLAPHVSPVHVWPLALLAMTFPYQVMVHVAFLGWWFLFRRKRMLLSGAALLIGWGHVSDHFELFGRSEAPADVAGTPVKLMSYNVRVFDLYNWSHNKATRDAIFALFRRENADILCLQEYFHSPDRRYFRTTEDLLKDFRYRYAHEHFTQKGRFGGKFGIATFSAWPIVRKGEIEFPENPNNQCMWSDIAIRGDTIRVYNAHMASYYFGDADYKFIGDLDTDTKADSIKSGGRRILRRLRSGLMRRADEVERIAKHMATSPHPVVYCGDMNDVPMSYSYEQLREDMSDAFTESGSGMGGTYIGKLPSLRIDHILYGPALESWDFQTVPDELSDHHAVTTMLGVKKKE
ncbi:MAG: endonuclease/exonuclease/phosphatase family protein [Flavobacteriales bacterium]